MNAEEMYSDNLSAEIHDSLIDADRIVREEFGDAFPNFALYRLVLCGDHSNMRKVREWWEVFCVLWVQNNMRKKPADEVVLVAAWDSLQRFFDPSRPILSDEYVQSEYGFDADSYRVMRKGFGIILSMILERYMHQLANAYAKVRARERRQALKELGIYD